MKRYWGWFRRQMPSIQFAIGIGLIASALLVVLLAISLIITAIGGAVDGIERVASSIDRDDPTPTITRISTATPRARVATVTVEPTKPPIPTKQLTQTPTATTIANDGVVSPLAVDPLPKEDMTQEEAEFVDFVVKRFHAIGDELDEVQRVSGKYGGRAYSRDSYNEMTPIVGRLAVQVTMLSARDVPPRLQDERDVFVEVAELVYSGVMKLRDGAYQNDHEMIDESAADLGMAGDLLEGILQLTQWWEPESS